MDSLIKGELPMLTGVDMGVRVTSGHSKLLKIVKNVLKK